MKENLNPFAISQMQLDEAATLLQLDPDIHAFLREPMREFHFSIPVRMDDGRTTTFQGFRVQYNDALGPAKGGTRFHPDETIDTVRALAAWMTWKSSVANIPLGGGKGGVICNPRALSRGELERLSRGYIRNISRYIGLRQDVPAPDVNTNPQIMSWMLDEYETITGKHAPGTLTGKPLSLGGSAGRTPAAGMGGLFVVREMSRMLGLSLEDTSCAIQGYGNVGSAAHWVASDMFGLRVVAVSDEFGGIFNEKGLDPKIVSKHLQQTDKVIDCPGTTNITNKELLELNVDILVPAAIENQITQQNANQIQAKVIAELANGPVTPEADDILNDKGVYVIPDILCSAGGVIVSYLEMVQNAYQYYWTEDLVRQRLDQTITSAFQMVYERSTAKRVPMRKAAYMVAVNRVAEAAQLRGWV